MGYKSVDFVCVNVPEIGDLNHLNMDTKMMGIVKGISGFKFAHLRVSTSWWFPTHLKNMLIKLDNFPNFRGEHRKMFETSTQKISIKY